jgi:hypothetical protein
VALVTVLIPGKEKAMFTRLRRSWLVVPALLALTFLALGK